MLKTTCLTCCGVALASLAFAQAPTRQGASPLATASGHELTVSGQHYRYAEPDPTVDIAIAGLKLGGEYTGTWVFNRRRHWFAQLNARVTGGPADYDGWCRPWQIEPSATSSNGYRLTLGTRSKCTEDNDSDWYAEGRVVVEESETRST